MLKHFGAGPPSTTGGTMTSTSGESTSSFLSSQATTSKTHDVTGRIRELYRTMFLERSYLERLCTFYFTNGMLVYDS